MPVSASETVGSSVAERRLPCNPFTRPSGFAAREILTSLPQLGTLRLRSPQRHIADRFTHPVLRQVLACSAVFLGARPGPAAG